MARGLEAVTERILRREGQPVLTPHAGYAEPDALVPRGRVVSAVTRGAPDADQARWRNFRQMVSLFLTSEVAAMPVTAAGVTAMTDSEGCLTLRVPRDGADAGWRNVPVRDPGGDPVDMPVLAPRRMRSSA